MRGDLQDSDRARREVARLLLLDPDDRVLLFLHRDPEPPERSYWYLPGGAIEADETPEAAASRELLEETGIGGASIGPVVAHLIGVQIAYQGREIEQDEWHVLGRVGDSHVGDGRAGDFERDAVAAHRWWAATELASTNDAVYPVELPNLIERLIHEGPPVSPWLIDERSSARGPEAQP